MSIQPLDSYRPPPLVRPAHQSDRSEVLYRTIAGVQQHLKHFTLEETHWKLIKTRFINPQAVLNTSADNPGIVNLLKSLNKIKQLVDQTAFSRGPISRKIFFSQLSRFSKDLCEFSSKQISLIELTFGCSVSEGKIENIKFLLEESPGLLKCKNADGYNVFHVAAAYEQPHLLRYFLEKKPDFLLSTNLYGENAAHIAAKHGRLLALNFIVKKEPYLLYRTNSKGANPFHYAAAFGQLKTLQYLLRISPNLLFSKDRRGFNACHYAASKGHLDILQYLLSRWPLFLYYANKEGLDLFLLAIMGGQQEILDFLIFQRPAFLYSVDKNGLTSVHYAVKYEKPEILQFLLEAFDSQMTTQH